MKNILVTTIFSLFLIFSLQSCAQNGTNSTQKQTSKAAGDNRHPSEESLKKYSKATFASGCFWCVEAVYESVKGVKEVYSGYAGGTETNPSYEEVGAGRTGHAEAIEVYYDPAEISYETLLKVYFASQNPTQANGQGPDRGSQYRSIIFYRNEAEEKAAIEYKTKLTTSGKYDQPIAAEIVPFTKFWMAEGYHQNYVELNPTQGYVMGESIPRIKRFQGQMPELIKEGYRF